MRNTRKLLAILLCLAMCFSLLPTWAFAEEAEPQEQDEPSVTETAPEEAEEEQEEEPVEEQGEETITLRFSGFELQEELITRADADVSTIATRLDVWITDGESTQQVHQSAGDAGYGTVAVTLNKTKTYTIYAVAHKANGAATLAL